MILLVDELPGCARISLERDGACAAFAIPCGIHGWLVHTPFWSTEAQAGKAFNETTAELH
jgi:hypothetical protein